jgi:uncharacterized repeat protein (TIGR02543 family)
LPAPGWQFEGWDGEGVEDIESPSTTIVMDGARTVTAHFITDYVAWTRGHDLVADDALPGADPDADGMSNDLEYHLGFDPMNPGSRLTMSIGRRADNSLELTINRVIPDGTFMIETAPSPAGPWANGTPVMVAVPEWNHRVAVPGSGNTRFFRLRYSR